MSMRRPAPGGGDARGRVRLHRPLPPGPHRDGIVASERADPLPPLHHAAAAVHGGAPLIETSSLPDRPQPFDVASIRYPQLR